jgi:beta-lactamase superfamily II metal-dependent hydrolase
MLLTGDGRGDDILKGLGDAGLMDKKGRIHVDILKVPHHGSDKNVSREFFRRVRADHYVFSGDGSHENPEKSTLEMISTATKGSDDFTLYFTYRDGKLGLRKKLDKFMKAETKINKRKYGFCFRKEQNLSIKVDLLDEVKY